MFAINYFVFFLYIIKSVSSELHIQTNSGPIQGVSSLSEGVESFLGIPFAEPPVGDLRFAKTVPKKQWTEILNASKISSPCPQVSIGNYYYIPSTANMSEDCLYLNIWTPKSVSNSTLKPIIIYFYPGAFIVGASNFHAYDGANLAKRADVIVVTANYRLGAFGYFLAYTEEANGNMGMYDQVMAIKWMKENALAFGGDPVNIVLMGDSAGSIAISLHMISPISKHLFNKAIIQSGGGMTTFMYENNTKLFANSEAVASFTGCANGTVNLRTNPHAVIDCLKLKSVTSVLSAMQILVNTKALFFFPRTGDEFLPQSPAELLNDRKFRTDVPVLTGINSDEGTMLLATILPEYFDIYGKNPPNAINKHFASFVARTLLSTFKISNATEVTHYYMNTVKNQTAIEYSKMLAKIVGDYIISCSTIFQADFFSSNGNPVYFFTFATRSAVTPFAEWMGTPHLEITQYIFGHPYHEKFSEEDMKMSTHLIARWSTFARTGDPNIPGKVPWLPYSHQSPKYLKIQHEDKMIDMEPIERCRIWRTRFKAVLI